MLQNLVVTSISSAVKKMSKDVDRSWHLLLEGVRGAWSPSTPLTYKLKDILALGAVRHLTKQK